MNFSRWSKLLVEPRSKDDDSRRREFILNVLLISSIAVAVLALGTVLVRFFNLGDRYDGESPLFATVQVAIFVVLWILSRKGFFVQVAYAIVIIFFLLAFYMLSALGILMPQGVLLLSLVLIMSSILLGTRVAAILTFTASVILMLLGVLQHSGRLTFNTTWMKTPGGPTDAFGFALTLVVITTVSWLSNREIERFNLTLQEQVHKATSRLRAANKNLQVLDKAKDDFISMASHQLGTPLTAITGYLSMAIDEDKHNMTPAQREYINFALEASERMVAMSSDLLNASRLNSGRFMIQRQPVDLNRMAEQEVRQLIPAAERKGIKLSYTPCPDLPPISIDESKTRQVVMNYIDNAIYYTHAGEVRVKIEQANKRAVFTVVDTGIGVPAAEQSKLFAKFYRAENARAARPDGTGLGLYLAKRVIEEQGGTIIFQSEEGKGSTFGFSLPL